MRTAITVLALSLLAAGCSTLPSGDHHDYDFPKKEAFVKPVARPFKRMGIVKAKAEFQTIEENEEQFARLCKSYYNKAVKELVKLAKRQDADAVVEVRSVVFMVDGRFETHDKPECSEEDGEGQALVAGVAVKWLPPLPVSTPTPLPSPTPRMTSIPPRSAVTH